MEDWRGMAMVGCFGEKVGISTGVTLFPSRMDEVPRGFLMRTAQAHTNGK